MNMFILFSCPKRLGKKIKLRS